MRGRRAPELAAGKLAEFLDTLWEEKIGALLASEFDKLSVQQQVDLQTDIAQAKVHISMVLSQKCHFWEVLPWRLCGLAHHDMDVARASACACIQQFDRSVQQESLHHPLSWKLLGPDSQLRPDLIKFASGDVNLGDAPELELEVASLAFVPVVERVVERLHAEVHRAIATRHCSAPYVSFSARSHILQGYLSGPQDQQDLLCKFASSARDHKALLRDFGLDCHPRVQQLLQKKAYNSAYTTVAGKLLYNMDLETQYGTHKSARRQNRQAKAARIKAAVNLLQPRRKRKLSELAVEEYAAGEHFRKVAKAGMVFTLPAGSIVQTIQSQMQNPISDRSLASLALPAIADQGGELEHDNDDVFASAADVPPPPPLIFKLLHANPGKAVVLKEPLASGCRVGNPASVIDVIACDPASVIDVIACDRD